MTDFVKVKGHSDLHRDVNSNAVINTNASEYSLYMKRIKTRQKDNDKFKNAVNVVSPLALNLCSLKSLSKAKSPSDGAIATSEEPSKLKAVKGISSILLVSSPPDNLKKAFIEDSDLTLAATLISKAVDGFSKLTVFVT